MCVVGIRLGAGGGAQTRISRIAIPCFKYKLPALRVYSENGAMWDKLAGVCSSQWELMGISLAQQKTSICFFN